jgi:FkbM family methyltransferase
MSLCIDYALRSVRLILRYPSAIPHLISGISSVNAHINNSVRQEYLRAPIEFKKSEGFEIYLEPKGSGISPLVAIIGTYEPEVTWIFKKVLKQGDRVIDIGANIGWFTLLSARIVGRSGLVVSFEPEPENFSLLTKSICKNRFSNVISFNEVVSDIDGSQMLNLSQRSDLHSIVHDFGGERILVQASKLETVAKRLNLDRVDLVKIDVEGAEPQVISGMRSLVDDGRVLHMVIEWSPSVWAANLELLSWLFEAFNIYRINHVSFSRFTKMKKETLPLTGANLYLVKK